MVYKNYKTIKNYIPYNALVLALADSSISSRGLPLIMDISLAIFKIMPELLHRHDFGKSLGTIYGASVSKTSLFSGRTATVSWRFFNFG